MAYNFNNRHYQQIPEQYNLKPVNYAETASLTGSNNNYYAQPYTDGANLQRLSTQDETLKYRIRVLRMVSRAIAVLVSAATLAPLTMTVIKFLQTKDQIITVDGEQRTAWAAGTVSWYTFLYFGVSAVTFILNAVILASYCWGVKKANKASTFASVWSGVILVTHVVIWAVAVAIYRYGKVPKDGRSTDLWGWTCSTAADEIQSQVPNLDYSKYCTAQVSGSS